MKESPSVATVLTWGLAILGVPSAVGYLATETRNYVSSIAIIGKEGAVALDKGTYAISSLGMFLLYALAGALLLALGALWAKSRQVGGPKAEARIKVENAYNDVCDSIDKVVNNIYDANVDPRITFRKIHCVFRITNDGTTTVEQEYEVETDTLPANFWTFRLELDEYASRSTLLSDIGFDAQSTRPDMAIVSLPTDNRGNKRSIALFFLPEIPVGAARSFKLHYKWKGWFGELFKTGRGTNWEWSYRSALKTLTADVEFVFMFDAACGSIACSSPAPLGNSASLTETPPLAAAGTTWTYRNQNASTGDLRWLLRFTRRG